MRPRLTTLLGVAAYAAALTRTAHADLGSRPSAPVATPLADGTAAAALGTGHDARREATCIDFDITMNDVYGDGWQGVYLEVRMH